MNIIFNLIKLSQVGNDKVDFNTIVFKAELPKKVDIDNSKDLWIFLKTLIAGGALKIYVDMKTCKYIDSSGIGVLINATKLMRKHKGDIVLAGVSDEINNIFKVINLENFIKICNNEVEAMKSFRFV